MPHDKAFDNIPNNNGRRYVNVNSSDAMNDNDWESRRPKGYINLSDIIQEQTIDGRMATFTPLPTPQPTPQQHKRDSAYSFEPTEMTGRSTTNVQAVRRITSQPAVGNNSPSVEQILATSFSHDIRDLCTSFQSDKPSTNVNKFSTLGDSDRRRFTSDDFGDQVSFKSDEFVPADQVNSLRIV